MNSELLFNDFYIDYYKDSGDVIFQDQQMSYRRVAKQRLEKNLPLKKGWNVKDFPAKKFTYLDTLRYIEVELYRGVAICHVQLEDDGWARITHLNGFTDLIRIPKNMPAPAKSYSHNIKMCEMLSKQQITKFSEQNRLFDEYQSIYNPTNHSITYYTQFSCKYYGMTRVIYLPNTIKNNKEMVNMHYKAFDMAELPRIDFDEWIAKRFSGYVPQIQSIEVDGRDKYFVIYYENGAKEYFLYDRSYVNFIPKKYIKYNFSLTSVQTSR